MLSLDRLIRYTIGCICMLPVVFWSGYPPPTLNESMLQRSVGAYVCKSVNTGKNSWKWIVYVDGNPYMRSFSQIFGFRYGIECDYSINGRLVEAYWLPVGTDNQRLLVQLVDKQNLNPIGGDIDQNLLRYKYEVADKSYLFAVKAALLILASLFFFWRDFDKSKSKLNVSKAFRHGKSS
jgi:hypothetical protein